MKMNLTEDKENFIEVPSQEDISWTIAYLWTHLWMIIPKDKFKNWYTSDTLLISWNEYWNYQTPDAERKAESNLLGLLLLLLQIEGYTDIHCRVKGNIFEVEWRRNTLLYAITIDDLIRVYQKNQGILSKYAKGYILWFIKENMKLTELKFNLQSTLGIKMYETIVSSFMEFSGITFTWNVNYKDINSQTTLRFNNEVYNYRNVFVPSMMEWMKYYNIVTRLLIVRVIKPSYWKYEKMILSLLDAKWGLLITWKVNSWKTSSLAWLIEEQHRKEPQKAYYTFEEPVEKTIDFATQFEVYQNPSNKEEGMGFKDFLKASLRMDSNNIVLWEIRDLETLNLSWELTNVWCTIYSTFHAWNLLEVRGRINKMKSSDWDTWDFDSFLTSTKAIIAQELVPKFTNSIKIWEIKDKELLKQQKEIIIDIIKTAKMPSYAGLLTSSFHQKARNWLPLLYSNELYSEAEKKPLIHALTNDVKKFAQFICDNFYVPVTKETEWMYLVSEVFITNSVNKEALKEEKFEQFKKAEKIFIPNFLKVMIDVSSNWETTMDYSKMDFNSIYNLAGTY